MIREYKRMIREVWKRERPERIWGLYEGVIISFEMSMGPWFESGHFGEGVNTRRDGGDSECVQYIRCRWRVCLNKQNCIKNFETWKYISYLFRVLEAQSLFWTSKTKEYISNLVQLCLFPWCVHPGVFPVIIWHSTIPIFHSLDFDMIQHLESSRTHPFENWKIARLIIVGPKLFWRVKSEVCMLWCDMLIDVKIREYESERLTKELGFYNKNHAGADP